MSYCMHVFCVICVFTFVSARAYMPSCSMYQVFWGFAKLALNFDPLLIYIRYGYLPFESISFSRIPFRNKQFCLSHY